MDKYRALHSKTTPQRSSVQDIGATISLNDHQGHSQELLATQLDAGTEPQLSVPRNYEWFADMLRNRPQVHSLRAGILIMISGGVYMSLHFYPSHHYISTNGQISWFVAVMMGAFASAVFMEKFSKRVFYLLASILVLLSGLVNLLEDNYRSSIIIAQCLNGFAFGLTLIATIVLGSEQSVKRFRGHVLGLEQCCLVIGMIVNQCLTEPKVALGLFFAILLGGFALYSTFFDTIESPITYLRQGNETEATNTLVRLQKPHVITPETHSLLSENKHLLQEDIARGSFVNYSNGLIPLLKVCVFRAIVAMSFGTLLLVPSQNSFTLIFVCVVIRFIGVFMAHMGILDSLGRRTVSAVSLLIGGLLLIGFGISTSFELVIAYQLFAGLIAPASTCYLGEAFSISVKANLIAVAVAFENIVQIIILTAYSSDKTLPGFGYTLGITQILGGIIFYYVMPETKNTTLREALALFGNKLSADFRI